jgi:precorrin-3B synthase
MSAEAVRGACPGITHPMQTGDGLLARLIPIEPIPIQAFQILAAAAAELGNGILEVTQRGSLQVRGLGEGSARRLADIVVSLGIRQNESPSLITSPLLGMEAHGQLESADLAQTLRSQMAKAFAVVSADAVSALSPKVAVLLDGGGSLHLDSVSADIRLRATSSRRFELAVAGDAATAVPLKQIELSEVVATVLELLTQIARLGPRGRARDLAFPKAPGQLAVPRPRSSAIGLHLLRDGTVARGFGLAFGHTTTAAIKRLVQAGAERGARAIRPAPGRAILIVGLTNSEAANELDSVAAAEGFIVDEADPRRHIVACAGAPACSAATLQTRQLAPKLLEAARSLAGTDKVIHLSGCAKGCAHPGPAALTLVGPNHWLTNGRAGAAPQGTFAPVNVVSEIERLCLEIAHG